MEKIYYKTTKVIEVEHTIDNVDEKFIFLKSKYDYCNRDVNPYFAQFLEDNSVYTITLENNSWTWNIETTINDTNSMSFVLNIKKWIEKYKGQFEVITADEFFKHYENVLEIISKNQFLKREPFKSKFSTRFIKTDG